MKIILCHRHYGVHSPIKEIEISGKFADYYNGENDINEELLLKNLPKNFLPSKPSQILLTVEDRSSKTEENVGSTGQRGLKLFLNWSKYFDAYSLELCREDCNG